MSKDEDAKIDELSSDQQFDSLPDVEINPETLLTEYLQKLIEVKRIIEQENIKAISDLQKYLKNENLEPAIESIITKEIQDLGNDPNVEANALVQHIEKNIETARYSKNLLQKKEIQGVILPDEFQKKVNKFVELVLQEQTILQTQDIIQQAEKQTIKKETQYKQDMNISKIEQILAIVNIFKEHSESSKKEYSHPVVSHNITSPYKVQELERTDAPEDILQTDNNTEIQQQAQEKDEITLQSTTNDTTLEAEIERKKNEQLAQLTSADIYYDLLEMQIKNEENKEQVEQTSDENLASLILAVTLNILDIKKEKESQDKEASAEDTKNKAKSHKKNQSESLFMRTEVTEVTEIEPPESTPAIKGGETTIERGT